MIPRYNFLRASKCGRGPLSQIDQYPQGCDRQWSKLVKAGIVSLVGNDEKPTGLLGGLYFPNGGALGVTGSKPSPPL